MLARIGTTALWMLVAAVVALVLGGATSSLQTVLPDALRPFANSNSGWALLTFAVLLACTSRISARTWWTAVGIGLVTFHLLLQGYSIVSSWRGYRSVYGPGDFYFTVATLVGPVIGLAGYWWWSRRPVIRALSVAFITAVMVGDGVQGLAFVAQYTGATYWVISIVIGAAFGVYGLTRRFHGARERLVAGGLTLAATCGYVAVWSVFQTVGF